MKYVHLREVDFIRTIETNTIDEYVAQEDPNKPLKFFLFGISRSNNIAYTIRHGRENIPRSRGLEYLGIFLEKHKVESWVVQHVKRK